MTEETFERVARTYGDMLYRVAYHALKNRADAEDVTQTVLLKLYQQGDRFESEEHRKHWLLRAAWARACSTSLKSRFSLDSNNNHFHSRFQSKAGGSGPLSKQRPAWEYSPIIPRDGSAYAAPGWRAPWTAPGRAPGRPHP